MAPPWSRTVWIGRRWSALFGSVWRTLASLLVAAFVLQLAAAFVPVLTWRAGSSPGGTVEFMLHGREFHGNYRRGWWGTEFSWMPEEDYQGWALTYPDQLVPPWWSRVHDAGVVRQHLVDGFLSSPTEIGQALAYRRESAMGFPFRSLACMLVNEVDSAGELMEDPRCEGGYRLEPFRVTLIDDEVLELERVVPLRPLAAGMALNTLAFWAGLLVLAWIALRVRTLVRFERGCCPRCGGGTGFDFREGCVACRWRPRAAGRARG
jgi:hypothetical protein